MIRIACPSCQCFLKLKSELAGKKVRCPQCKQAVMIPDASRTESARTEAHLEASEDKTFAPRARAHAEASHEAAMTVEHVTGTQRETLEASARYEVEAEIARGGMGAIMRAVDRDIHREVAVKFLLHHADARQKARFVEEAQITGQLEHPNIVPIHQLGMHEDGRCFFSMKMVKGRSLAQILKDEDSQGTLSRLLNILVGVCNALSYAHARRVIHRDLKPANIMVGDFGETYVMDWGLAKVLTNEQPLAPPQDQIREMSARRDLPTEERITTNSREETGELTQAGAIMGTPAYMPPEQAQGDHVDERADIYSLGAILYEIMTLTPPVGRGGDMMAVLMRVMEGQIDPPQKRAPERAKAGWVPPELAAIAMKALARQPADRYPTVASFRLDLERFQEGRSVSAKRDSAWELVKKFSKRNKGLAIASLVGGVLLLVVLIGSSLVNYRERVRADNALAKFRQEERNKQEQARQSAPAFLRAARLLVNDKQFDDALTQAKQAADNDPELAEAYLMQGQLLIGLEKYPEAVQQLKEYLRREPGNLGSQRLSILAQNPAPEKAAFFVEVGEILTKQKMFPLAGRMSQRAALLLGPLQERLPVYRKQIDAAWPRHGKNLILNKSGQIELELISVPDVRDLTPIQGIPVSILNLRARPITDLGPLRGMPLVRLSLFDCVQIKDLNPVEGLPITHIDLSGVPLRSCESLRHLPALESLTWSGSTISDLAPLQGVPLKTLILNNNYGRIHSLEPLRGMKLTRLEFSGGAIQDIEPLKDMPLQTLVLNECFRVKDLRPLRGLPLEKLDLKGIATQADLQLLQGMPLNWLSLTNCVKIDDLEPLRKLPLQFLSLTGCAQISDLRPLQELPLTELHMNDCKKVTGLEGLRGTNLLRLHIMNCEQVTDLTPLSDLKLTSIYLTPRRIAKGMEVLRTMKSLSNISVAPNEPLAATEFWKRFDNGEFK